MVEKGLKKYIYKSPKIIKYLRGLQCTCFNPALSAEQFHCRRTDQQPAEQVTGSRGPAGGSGGSGGRRSDRIAPMAARAASVCFSRSDSSAISASHGIAWAAVPLFQPAREKSVDQGEEKIANDTNRFHKIVVYKIIHSESHRNKFTDRHSQTRQQPAVDGTVIAILFTNIFAVRYFMRKSSGIVTDCGRSRVSARDQPGIVEEAVLRTGIFAERQPLGFQCHPAAMPKFVGRAVAGNSEQVMMQPRQVALAPTRLDSCLGQHDHRIDTEQLLSRLRLRQETFYKFIFCHGKLSYDGE